MIATLPMYDLPWLRMANDRLWTGLADRLKRTGINGVPDFLSRDMDLDEAWRSPQLLLGQTCGYPLLSELRESVQIVATPRYRAEGCTGAEHRAAILVRADDGAATLAEMKGRRVGVNGARSNSGMNMLRTAVAPYAVGQRFFARVTITGSHARSIAALLTGRIDVAAVDAVTLALLRERYPRHTGRLRLLDWTAATPGLPLVAAAGVPAATIVALRDALDAVARDPALAETRRTLRIDGFELLDLADYAPVLALEAEAASCGYATLQ